MKSVGKSLAVKVGKPFMFALAISYASIGQAGTITTLAGVSEYGQATTAMFNGPSAIAKDSRGNNYILDVGNNRIRKLDSATGVLSTIAGSATQGFSGDGGAASSAVIYLSYASTIAFDGQGNLYYSEPDNKRVRKIDAATGVISTVAGGGSYSSRDDIPATLASLTSPSAVAADSAGNLYIGENSTYARVRKVSSAGMITTVAGSSSCSSASDDNVPGTSICFSSSIRGLALDNNSNLYIADAGGAYGGSNKIRKLALSTGTIYVIAGGVKGNIDYLVGDGGLAANTSLVKNYDGTGPISLALDTAGNLYFGGYQDYLSGQNTGRAYGVRKVDVQTGVISTYAGGGGYGAGSPATSLELGEPSGIAFDSLGNLIVVERVFDSSISSRIRSISPAGQIATIAGTGVAGFGTGDGGDGPIRYGSRILADAAGNVYISDAVTHQVRKYVAANRHLVTIAGTGSQGYSGDGGSALNAKLNQPAGMALDGQGNLYIADYGNYCVRKISASTGTISTYAGICTVSASSGNGGLATAATLKNPVALTFDASGNLFIADNTGYMSGEVRKVSSSGVISTVASGLKDLEDLATDSAGNLYIKADSVNSIYVVSAGQVSVFSGNGAKELTSDAMVSGASNNLLFLFSGSGSCKITSTSISSKASTTIAGGSNCGYAADGVLSTLDYASRMSTPDGSNMFILENKSNGTSISSYARLRAITISQNPHDCLFNWAEKQYAQYLSPAGATSATLSDYYYRYYSGTNSYLATKSSDNHLYFMGPATGNAIADLGAVSTWVTQAGCQ
jgi:sugar lactone lactonase YvrE